MITFKNFSPSSSFFPPLKPLPSKVHKIITFPICSQFFANGKYFLDRHLSGVGPIKAVAEEERNLIGEEKNVVGHENEELNGRELEGNDNKNYNNYSNDNRLLNAAIVLGAGTLAITKLLTVDHDYWHGWTLYEVLRYAPEHNWIAYEQALKSSPVLAKMVISGIVYFIGDWIAQCYEGKPLFEFDSKRMFRSGIVGFLLHGSLSHYYYQFCEALFPFKDWWVVPAKVAFDQTLWAAIWNSIYFLVLGFLRFESPSSVYEELKAKFWPMLTAGWKLWPFAHLITYGVIPVEQRLLWVDCVELIWVTILSGYSNETSEGQISESAKETNLIKSPNKSQEKLSKNVSGENPEDPIQ